MTAPQVAQLLAEHDIPVGSQARIADPARPEQSLLGHRDRPEAAELARAAGALTARLHVVPTGGADEPALPAASIGDRIPAAEDVIAVLPERTPRRIRAVLGAIEACLLDAPHDGSLIHGHLTPDRIMVQPGTEASARIGLTALERTGTGPDGADLGAWLARCTTLRAPDLAGAFLAGYGARLPLPEEQELGAWTARALLLSGLDPDHHSDGESSDSRFALAETVLDGGVLAAAP